MEKLNIIRNAVRCLYIKNEKVICLITKETNSKPGFYDIPGGNFRGTM